MYRCAIIGCGRIAGGYDDHDNDLVRTHAKAFFQHKNCRLVGVCDTDHDTAVQFSDKWGADVIESDPEKLIEKTKPDIISICSPTHTHKTYFELACSKGIKTIWLEKPAAESTSAVEKMLESARQSEVFVCVNYFRRFDIGLQKVKQSIPALGDIQTVRALYTKGWRHTGSHIIDLISWFFGPISNVQIIGEIADPDFPTLSAKLITESATVDVIGLDHHSFELFELDIIGKEGRIKIIDGGQEIYFEHVVEGKYYKGYRNLKSKEFHSGSYGYFMQKGLELILSKSEVPDLCNELAVQKVFDKAV